MPTLGETLRTAREAKGWSQTWLSRRSGVPTRTISGIECGDVIAVAHLPALERELGMPDGTLTGLANGRKRGRQTGRWGDR